MQAVVDLPFVTEHAIAAVLPEGNLDFRFIMPSGVVTRTTIGPELAVMFASMLDEALASLPRPPKTPRHGFPGTRVPGGATEAETKATYFGQAYPIDILQALGVLMIRANLLERSLIELLSGLSQIETRRAEALFYSTVNMRARLDMIKALVPACSLEEREASRITRLLDRVNGISRRRNDLVHGQWSFARDKLRVEPSGVKAQPIHVTAQYILKLASDYRRIGVLLTTLGRTLGERDQTEPREFGPVPVIQADPL
ncbi:MAG TPA: hypothetical protein VF744_14465 [Beijerinckiaceae bacterium]|jgi:hypothetical protein